MLTSSSSGDNELLKVLSVGKGDFCVRLWDHWSGPGSGRGSGPGSGRGSGPGSGPGSGQSFFNETMSS